ncbi:MAG: flagellar cap protein FliD N-terminal domain-containing protein, partial [Angelakisella sp.]
MAINSLSSASKGMSGLVSGMDTQSMVDAMLAGTQAKIDKQKANKTILGYKRDIYRNTLTDLKNFQNNFFKFGSKTGTNMLSTDFYNSLTALNKSSAFKVTAGSSALAGKTTINSIEQLAQSLKLKSTLDKTTADVKGTLDISQIKEGSEIQMVLDGVSKMIKLPQGAASDAEFVAQLNASIQQTFGNGVSASLDGGVISFNAADSSREFKISGNLDAMGALGLKSGVSNKMSLYMSLGDINFAQPLSGSSFKFNINGVDFEVTENDSLNTVISKINSSNANVKVRYSAIEDKFSIESTISGKGTKIEMSQSEGNLLTALFGEGSSGSIVGKQLYSYGDITAKLPGVPENVGTPPTADEQKLIDEAIALLNSNVDRFATASVGEFVLKVDGKDIKIKLPPREKDPADATKELPYTMEHLIKAINDNTELDAKGIKLSLDIQNGNFTGGVTMKANEGVHIDGGSAFAAIGLSAKTTNEKTATEDATLASMGIAGPLTVKIGAETLSFTANQTLSEVTAAMENKLKEQATAAGQTAEQVGAIKVEVLKAPPGSEGKIRLFGVDIPVDIQIGGDGNKLFGTDKLTLNGGGKALATVTEGKNA